MYLNYCKNKGLVGPKFATVLTSHINYELFYRQALNINIQLCMGISFGVMNFTNFLKSLN